MCICLGGRCHVRGDVGEMHSSSEAAHHWTQPTVQEGNPSTSYRNQVSVVVLNPFQYETCFHRELKKPRHFEMLKPAFRIRKFFGPGSGFFHHFKKKNKKNIDFYSLVTS